jgi:hypothetical protein
MKRIYSPTITDALTAIGIIAAFYGFLAVVAIVAF